VDQIGDDISDETQLAGRGSTTRMPRWVKIFLIIGLLLVLLFVVGKVTGVGGEHGPGRHGRGDDTPSSVVNHDDGHRPPVEHRP
jgi:hypothetical protein